jgi:hypothetical protein
MEKRLITSGMPPYRRTCPALASSVEDTNERGLYQYHEAKQIAAVAAMRQTYANILKIKACLEPAARPFKSIKPFPSCQNPLVYLYVIISAS